MARMGEEAANRRIPVVQLEHCKFTLRQSSEIRSTKTSIVKIPKGVGETPFLIYLTTYLTYQLGH